MLIYDITVPLNAQTPQYPGDPCFLQQNFFSKENGASANVSTLCLGTHSGTHIDAPSHHFSSAQNTDSLGLERLIGKSRVIDLRGCSLITRKELEPYNIQKSENILLKTDNEDRMRQKPFWEQYVSLDRTAAEYLAECGVNLIGIDYLSIESYNASDAQAHKILLKKNIIILEGIVLDKIEPGQYDLLVLPLNIAADGAPARVILMKEEGKKQNEK